MGSEAGTDIVTKTGANRAHETGNQVDQEHPEHQPANPRNIAGASGNLGLNIIDNEFDKEGLDLLQNGHDQN